MHEDRGEYMTEYMRDYRKRKNELKKGKDKLTQRFEKAMKDLEKHFLKEDLFRSEFDLAIQQISRIILLVADTSLTDKEVRQRLLEMKVPSQYILDKIRLKIRKIRLEEKRIEQ